MPRCLLLLTFLACPALAAGPPVPAKLPAPTNRQVSFEKDIQPLLSRACFSCHGAEKQRAGLRLDIGARALQGGNSGAVIKPGDSAGSMLIHLVAGLDAERRMPPGKGKELKPEEVGLLRAWIDQGAKYPKDAGISAGPARSTHWSFQPITNSPLPKIANGHWPR